MRGSHRLRAMAIMGEAKLLLLVLQRIVLDNSDVRAALRPKSGNGLLASRFPTRVVRTCTPPSSCSCIGGIVDVNTYLVCLYVDDFCVQTSHVDIDDSIYTQRKILIT